MSEGLLRTRISSLGLFLSGVWTRMKIAVQMAFFRSARNLLLVGVQEGLLDKGVFITTRS